MTTKAAFWQQNWKAYGGYTIATLAVMLPLLLPGYVLTLDMVFTPVWRMPETITSSYPLYVLLHIVNLVVPSQIIQKIILLAIPLLASIGTHRLIVYLQGRLNTTTQPGIYIASLFYAINPFTYSRFMTGQYLLLLGYALLPWVVLLMLRLVQRPTPWASVSLGLLVAVVGMISIHTLGLIAVLGGVGIICLALYYRQALQLRAGIVSVVIAGITFLAASSYWLLPLLTGQGRTAQIVNTITANDFSAFAVTGNTVAMQLWHILSLQGLWSEARNLYLLPQSIFPLWYVFVFALWAGVVGGLVWLWRHWRPGAWWLIGSIVIGGILALGFPIDWLAAHIPAVAGFREPHKFVGIICLSYALLLAFGIPADLRRLRDRAPTTHMLALSMFWALPFGLAPTMLWGFAGQLQPRHYPPEWYQANQTLNRDSDDFQVLFLPWHQYMRFTFSERTIANPARQFFDKPTIVSSDPELEGAVATSANPTSERIGQLLETAAQNQDLAQQLAQFKVKYIVLTHEADYQDYQHIATQPGLKQTTSNQRLTIYQNTFYKP